jgi:hypothetical protein
MIDYTNYIDSTNYELYDQQTPLLPDDTHDSPPGVGSKTYPEIKREYIESSKCYTHKEKQGASTFHTPFDFAVHFESLIASIMICRNALGL